MQLKDIKTLDDIIKHDPLGLLGGPLDHSGHRGNGGVQNHSCGPIYPYHVVIQGASTLYAMHSSGLELTHHRYGKEHRQTFKEAYAKAGK